MGLLARLMGRSVNTPDAVREHAVCTHRILAPRWDRAEDMGHDDRATAFVCASCHRTFTVQEALPLLGGKTQ